MNDRARVRRLSRVYEPSVASDGARVLVGAHDIEHNDVVALAD